MVPTSVILVVLTVSYFPAAWGYFWSWPKRRIMNVYFLVLGGVAAVMLFTILLVIVGIQAVWVSWLLLAIAFGLFAAAIRLFRKALASIRARDRALAASMATRR